MHASRTTLDDLDWPALLGALASLARSDMGKAQTLALRFHDDPEALRTIYSETEEALELLQLDREPPLGDLFDIEQEVRAAERGSAVPGLGLLNVAAICHALLGLRAYAFGLPQGMPRLRTFSSQLADLRPLAHKLERSLDARGEISDNASAELKSLRQNALALHDELMRELDTMLVELDQSSMLSDRFVSLRNDRFVIPVKVSEQARVPGIIHDASQTGHTVFIEPAGVIERGNRLKWLRACIAEEERRVLLALSTEVAGQAMALREGVAVAVHFDVLFARARLAQRLTATKPELKPAGAPILLYGAKHPLLILQGVPVVGNDLFFRDGERGLVLTGPNTGGKTAALKTLGIAVLMARAGLFVPASAAQVPLLSAVYSVIGDNQSLTRALSTFSYHVKEIQNVLSAVPQERASLVLLDELCADTDPRLGSALGRAILEALVAPPSEGHGAWVVVTTHYAELAALGATQPAFATAAFGFDFQRMQPTYRLERGSLGASSPFEIALKLGLAPAIVARARTLTGGEERAHDTLIAQLQNQRDALVELRASAATDRAAAADALSAAEKARAQAEEERTLARSRALELLGGDLKEAQDRVREAVRTLQRGTTAEADPRTAFKVVEQVRKDLQTVEKILPEAPTAAPEEVALQVGQAVKARGLVGDAVGEIVAIDAARKEAVVALGSLRLRQPLADLRPVAAKRQSPRPRPALPRLAQHEEPAEGAPIVLSGDKLDVRGARAAEAIREIEHALDLAMKEQRGQLTVLHGHGTGALKDAVREYLSYSPYVRSYRPGMDHEGRDAVTIVDL
jgi:DNA mismatch repair protein MutS2